ncbi:MAG: S46 family peptidase [Bacteroidetes bacterium]|nr:S46 family peptidase [Bacteroidota bacterium]
MKKISVFIIALAIAVTNLKADEGMWLPYLLGNKTYADMVKHGLKLTKEQLYNINKPSIKDAIVLFGNGCTGEIVSKEGLLFTNHHCGYSDIAAVSTPENNHLKNGFWAKSKSDEIACPGLSVQFLIKVEDVTSKVQEQLKTVAPSDLATKLPSILNELSKKASENSIYEVRISSFFKGNQFLQFTYLRYKDVRLVGTPPESIGKFGGDTDNWEWPRHTGDFSIFRVYMGKDGKPAEYLADNIPYSPNYFLPVSIKGFKDGDYSMIFGYPASTNRYETTYGIKLKLDIENPSVVNLRDTRLKLMHAEMVKDPKVKLQLAGRYAQIANYWKFFDGESKQLIQHNTLEQKQTIENDFQHWAKGKKEYENIFSDLKTAYDNWRPYAKHRIYIFEGILGSPLMAFAVQLNQLIQMQAAGKLNDKTIAGFKAAYTKFIKAENIASDKNTLAAMLKAFYKDIDATQQPKDFYSAFKPLGSLDSDVPYQKMSETIFSNSMLLDESKFNTFLNNPDTIALKKDIAFDVASTFFDNYNNNYNKYYNNFIAETYRLTNLYLKGVLERESNKENLYPDANQTMRVSYGNVKSYQPRDGVFYNQICTSKGLLEKYKPGDLEFDMPEKLIDLIKAKDFGAYVDKASNDLVVTFITNNDITGGNSGSPVLNASGELIGLAFDGNYEALGHKIAIDKNLNRTICLDVRYLLFIVDKLGGAKNLINELSLK